MPVIRGILGESDPPRIIETNNKLGQERWYDELEGGIDCQTCKVDEERGGESPVIWFPEG
jgi:hypothetical protein